MQTAAKSNAITARTRPVIRAAVARWRFGSDDFLASIDTVTPPDVSVSADMPVPASRLDSSRELATLVDLSLLRTKEVLEMPMDPCGEPEETNARARVLLSAARTALQTQLRADANVLKRRVTSAHTAMLRDLKALKGVMDARTIEHG